MFIITVSLTKYSRKLHLKSPENILSYLLTYPRTAETDKFLVEKYYCPLGSKYEPDVYILDRFFSVQS